MSTRLERVLYVDLTERTARATKRSELFAKYLGGTGVASKLLLEECQPRISALSPEAPIIFTTGPLVGIFPSMAKTVAVFKSPLTGNLGESHAGGRFSTALRFAGYGAIVIKGASDEPVRLSIENGKACIEDASPLWGLSPLQVERLIKPSNGGVHSVMSIGRAGENLVHYSGAIADRYHHFGRLGLGAVMGSKKLKAVRVSGKGDIQIVNSKSFRQVYNEIYERVVKTDFMKKYQEFGTAANVLELNELRALPSRNFSETVYENADSISGERFAQEFLERKISCLGCPVTCVHLATLKITSECERDPQGTEEQSKGMELVPYNYEPIFALGTNLAVSDPKGVLQLISLCEHLGLDAIMTGAVLAWATEAYEKGFITTDETMGLRPGWGDFETYMDMIVSIADSKNHFYATLARGVAAAAEAYGGEEFAITLGKNSPAGYFTGYGFLVGTLVGARHSHLSNAGYSIDQTGMTKRVTPEQIVDFLIEEEDWLNVLHSLIACYFTRSVYVKELIVRALAAVGIDITVGRLMRLGRKISRNLYDFKIREDFDLTKERIPRRLLETESPVGRLNPRVIQQMISQYVKKATRS
mgnify:CR=1 FL=1